MKENAAQFRVWPDAHGESVSLEHLRCGYVYEGYAEPATLDSINEKAAAHMQEVHGAE